MGVLKWIWVLDFWGFWRLGWIGSGFAFFFFFLGFNEVWGLRIFTAQIWDVGLKVVGVLVWHGAGI